MVHLLAAGEVIIVGVKILVARIIAPLAFLLLAVVGLWSPPASLLEFVLLRGGFRLPLDTRSTQSPPVVIRAGGASLVFVLSPNVLLLLVQFLEVRSRVHLGHFLVSQVLHVLRP